MSQPTTTTETIAPPAPQSPKRRPLNHLFHQISIKTSDWMGSPWAFVVALLIVMIWASTGPLVGFSDTWQLVINTGTTILTFLMLFLVQNTQNRDTRALHLKLDELIRAMKGARNELVNLESLSDDDLERLRQEFMRLQRKSAARGLADESQASGSSTAPQAHVGKSP